MPKPQGKCIFCGGPGLSKEHIYPAWIQKQLGKRFSHTTHTATLSSHKFERQGDPLTRKLRIVCKWCNNGWMSRLQTAAKPILARLLAHDWRDEAPDRLKILASWVAMTAMVVEFCDRETVTITPEERFQFKESQSPPPSWHIWAGRYDDLQDRFFLHSAMTTGLIGDNGKMVTEDAFHLNTILLGGMAFLVLAVPGHLHVGVDEEFLLKQGYIKIWPTSGQGAVPNVILTTDTSHMVHRKLMEAFCGKPVELPPLDPVKFADDGSG